MFEIKKNTVLLLVIIFSTRDQISNQLSECRNNFFQQEMKWQIDIERASERTKAMEKRMQTFACVLSRVAEIPIKFYSIVLHKTPIN